MGDHWFTGQALDPLDGAGYVNAIAAYVREPRRWKVESGRALEAASGSNHVISWGTETHRLLAARIDRLTGRRVRRIFMPPRLLRTIGRLNDAAGGRLASLPVAAALEWTVASPPIDGSRASRLLGIRYRDLDETLADGIRWWAANGVIDPRLAGRLAGVS